ncbi:MAG: hypothetical protein LKJ90_00040 [Faecalibacterium sp.]|jgi:DNA-binding SARP family transcriptional activator|nr:hypothetical protein [Faecalibacterium sp.]
MEDKKNLQITMFGDFSLSYNGNLLKLERTNTTKAMQALQLLIYYGENGVVRDTLLDLLYNDDNAVEPANNLKVTISNLRRLLIRAGLPQETTIRYRNGSYYWYCSVPCTLDTAEFSQIVQAAKKAEPTEKPALWLKACRLYHGDFLPHLQGESWAVAAGASYREQYFDCIKSLIRVLDEQQEWERLLPVVTEAAALYGLEEFQLARIDCLMHLQRYTEAKQVYEETVKGLQDDFDLGPSKALLERCRQLDVMTCERPDSIQNFQQTLIEEHESRGAYYCTYPGFIDAYRVVCRMLERNGQSAYLALCWLTDSKGHVISDREKLSVAMPKVSAAIRVALRRGDLYTQPSRDRFLILLVGTNLENCSLVTARILEGYRKDPARGISLSFKLAPVGNALNRDMFRQKPSWNAEK